MQWYLLDRKEKGSIQTQHDQTITFIHISENFSLNELIKWRRVRRKTEEEKTESDSVLHSLSASSNSHRHTANSSKGTIHMNGTKRKAKK